MTQLKQIIITVLLLMAFGPLAIAQSSALSPYEGATHTYTWSGLQQEVEYEFYITANANGNGLYNDELTEEFDFLSSSSGTVELGESAASVDVAWNTGASFGDYFVWIKVTNTSGCSNFRYVEVIPQPGANSIGFDVMASTECFNLEGNNFSANLSVLDGNSQPLSASHFPLLVEFSVNGESHVQSLSFDKQQLQIDEEWFAANPVQNTDVIVEIIIASDVNDGPVNLRTESGMFTHTLFAIPEIEFTEELRMKYNLNEEITAFINSSSDRTWRMEPK